MKKLFYISIIALLGLVGFTRANVDSMHVAPTTQTAISGSIVTFTVTGHNGTGIAYVKYILPKTASYDILYQNSTFTTVTLLNNALLSMGAEHDPIYSIPANSNFSVTITAKVTTNNRSFPPFITQAIFSEDTNFSTVLGTVNANITPIADLSISNILTGDNPSRSGDNVQYYIQLQNIGSINATGINFISKFPIPTLSTPTAIFNGTPHVYSSISYPDDFVWSGTYINNLNAGQSIIIVVNGSLMNNFSVGTLFNHTAKTTTASPEYTTGNNSALATGIVQALPDLRITKTLAPFTGYRAGDEVHYTINYGNSGGKIANNVVITDIVPAGIQIPVNTFTLGTLPVGSGGTILLTGTLSNVLTSGYIFVNTATINTTSNEINTGNNSATATGSIRGVANVSVNIIANNLTRVHLDNIPYGSGPSTMIQAISGDIVQLTLTYANFGNITGSNATIELLGTQGFITLGTFNGTIGTLPLNQTGTLIVTGIVGPRNYISFIPTVRLSYNSGQLITDNIHIQEPFVCGDGLLTRNEPCDTQDSLGVLYSGQVCENQQGICVLRTTEIINNACVNYQYTTPLGGIVTGQSCDSVTIPLGNASCASMTGSLPIQTNSGYGINFTCKGNNTNTYTPITIDCGNGTTITGTGGILYGTCNYASSFYGNAQGRVGIDQMNPACRVPVSEKLLQCTLTSLDGNIIFVDTTSKSSGRFRCETLNHSIAQTVSIDCGNNSIGGSTTANNTSQVETICSYNENSIPRDQIVTCSTDGIVCDDKQIIIDERWLGWCGNGIIEGYEECDDGMSLLTGNGTPASNCTIGCSLKDKTESVACFNVGNTNLSVQKGEILPFRWTLDNTKNIVAGNSCLGKNNGDIPKESIKCTFNIYNGTHKESDGNPVNSSPIVRNCSENTRNTEPIFGYLLGFENQWRSLKNAFGKYYLDANETNKYFDNVFGEYKISLDKVEYQYCLGENKQIGTVIDRVCNVNFAVTQPYLAQKSLFAMTPKSTDIRLDGYKTIDGKDLITTTDLNEIMVLNDTDYNGGTEVKTMINTFITKYDNLALTVPESSLNKTPFKDKGVTVKVVPSQKIYILQADTQKTVTLENIKAFTAPFTIVTKNIDLVIKGNVEYNGMFLVKNGTITFEQADVSGTDRCPNPQTVKGIFITDKGFVGTTQSLKNDNLKQKRCSYGNLHVKGILIGNGINDLVQSRRSQLNTWFITKSSAETAIKSERRNKIFDGAAVLIEYSPSLWNALPPGASEFTKVLNVYKK